MITTVTTAAAEAGSTAEVMAEEETAVGAATVEEAAISRWSEEL